jgi:hypothetical protein
MWYHHCSDLTETPAAAIEVVFSGLAVAQFQRRRLTANGSSSCISSYISISVRYPTIFVWNLIVLESYLVDFDS